ncbi:MAG: PilZ domain-containing protein [Myxococcota bacterium]
MPRHESRAAPRARRRYKVQLLGAHAFTNDISTGGFSVELMRVPRPGTDVSGWIEVGGTQYSFSGCVAWAKAGSANLALRGRMGVRFTQVAPELVKLIEAERPASRTTPA